MWVAWGVWGSSRIASLILSKLTNAKHELGLSPLEIALSTFTRTGRQEIAERAAAEWGCTSDMLTADGWFRTAHSLAESSARSRRGSYDTVSPRLGWRLPPRLLEYGSIRNARPSWRARVATSAARQPSLRKATVLSERATSLRCA